MDFWENRFAEESSAEQSKDGYMQKIDGAVGQTIDRAIRDALQTADPARRQAAAAWLWICCPDIAEQVDLPELHLDTIPTLAATYVAGG